MALQTAEQILESKTRTVDERVNELIRMGIQLTPIDPKKEQTLLSGHIVTGLPNRKLGDELDYLGMVSTADGKVLEVKGTFEISGKKPAGKIFRYELPIRNPFYEGGE